MKKKSLNPVIQRESIESSMRAGKREAKELSSYPLYPSS